MTIKKITKRALQLAGGTALLVLTAAATLVWCGLNDDIHKADVALVFGNTVKPGGNPSPRLQARLTRTLELYRGGWFSTIIVSDGIGKEGYDEAAVMKNYLVAHGIPKDRIITDNQGTTTYASAENTLRFLREHKLNSVLVVSQYFHVPRARLALKKFGITPIYSAHAQYFEARDIYSIGRELVGYICYSFRKYEMQPG